MPARISRKRPQSSAEPVKPIACASTVRSQASATASARPPTYSSIPPGTGGKYLQIIKTSARIRLSCSARRLGFGKKAGF